MDYAKESVKVYNKIAFDYANQFDKDTTDNKYIDVFLSYLNKESRILELGCGTGRLTRYIYDKGYNIKGLDLSKEMLNIAKKNHNKIKFVCKDIRKIDYKTDSFDALAIFYALFHLNKSEVLKLFPRINKILKKQGILGLILQEGSGEKIINTPLSSNEKLYLNLYTESEISSILKKFGFKILFVGRKSFDIKVELPYNKLFIFAKKL